MKPKNREKGAPAAATVLFIIFRFFFNNFDSHAIFDLSYLHFGTQKSILNRLWGVLGRLGRVLEASWWPHEGVLARLGGLLGASWRILARLGVSLNVLEPSWRRFDP